MSFSPSLLALVLLLAVVLVEARPVVRNIRSTHEFDRLLQKHASETGLPVVVDFYSDSCGPCRMMAPIFKKVAGEYKDKAVFVKIDTNSQPELSQRYQIRSLPTFQFFLNGQKVDQVSGGIGEGGLKQYTDKAVRGAEMDNVILTVESLTEYYAKHDPSKSEADVAGVHKKCVDMVRKNPKKQCFGDAANKLGRRLRKKYGKLPKYAPRFTEEDRKSDTTASSDKKKSERKTSSSSRTAAEKDKPNLHLASLDDLKAELEKRLDEERDREVENEDPDEDEPDPDFHRWTPSQFPERLVIVGGGPAGLAAAIYGARAGLAPLVIAPTMGGQLQGKGVDVENYPGLHNVTGPSVVASMRKQAAHFGAFFEDDIAVQVHVPDRSVEYKPIQLVTNGTGVIQTHTLIVATGADSNWLGIPGEWELRGGGVSSCATCDGFLYAGKDVLIVGGGDAAMEDALVLARTSKTVTLIHRRDQFRASKILADRVLNHPKINVSWNTVVKEIIGKQLESSADEENMDMDNLPMVVSGAVLQDVLSGEMRKVDCDAVFVAIGHTPNTQFLRNVVEFNPHHPGYIQTIGITTHTSVPGIFAAGDVADATYRQAITSAGSGAAAALDAERYLSENGLGNEAEEFEAELLAEMMADDNGSRGGSYNAYEESGGRMEGMKESMAAGEL